MKSNEIYSALHWQTYAHVPFLLGQSEVDKAVHAFFRFLDEPSDVKNHIHFTIAPKHRRALAGRHVAVVDDVLTSGATLNEIALTLRPVGVRSISVWVVARTPAPHTRTGTDHAD